jgi:fermentation-respiration switch protein FrsA (DUF1100 family)
MTVRVQAARSSAAIIEETPLRCGRFHLAGKLSRLYFPNHTYVSPSQAHPHKNFEELAVTTEDGLNLKGWYAPAKSKRFTLVFFHGNGDNLGSAAKVAGPYIDAGYGFLLAEYRGYSGLPGLPTEKGLYADATH